VTFVFNDLNVTEITLINLLIHWFLSVVASHQQHSAVRRNSNISRIKQVEDNEEGQERI